MPCPLKGPRPLPGLQMGRPEHLSAKQLLCPSWLRVGAFLPVHSPGDSRLPRRAGRACEILVQRERKGGWQPCAVWGAAAQSGLGSEACMPSLFCPWTTSHAPGGPPRNHAHWASEEAQRRHLLVAHPPPRNLSQHLLRQDLASRRPGWEPPWEAPCPGPAPLSKWLHLSEPQCSSSGEWVSKYPSV